MICVISLEKYPSSPSISMSRQKALLEGIGLYLYSVDHDRSLYVNQYWSPTSQLLTKSTWCNFRPIEDLNHKGLAANESIFVSFSKDPWWGGKKANSSRSMARGIKFSFLVWVFGASYRNTRDEREKVALVSSSSPSTATFYTDTHREGERWSQNRKWSR